MSASKRSALISRLAKVPSSSFASSLLPIQVDKHDRLIVDSRPGTAQAGVFESSKNLEAQCLLFFARMRHHAKPNAQFAFVNSVFSLHGAEEGIFGDLLDRPFHPH